MDRALYQDGLSSLPLAGTYYLPPADMDIVREYGVYADVVRRMQGPLPPIIKISFIAQGIQTFLYAGMQKLVSLLLFIDMRPMIISSNERIGDIITMPDRKSASETTGYRQVMIQKLFVFLEIPYGYAAGIP